MTSREYRFLTYKTCLLGLLIAPLVQGVLSVAFDHSVREWMFFSLLNFLLTSTVFVGWALIFHRDKR